MAKRKSISIALCSPLILLVAGLHAADHFENGDAGDVPAIAQDALGSGTLNAIHGTLSHPNDVDMYRVHISDIESFSAFVEEGDETLGELRDPMLSVISESGIILDFNDDFFDLGPILLPGMVSVPGIYFLAVSSFANFPVTTGIPEIPIDWIDLGLGGGSYTIGLSGVSAIEGPTPRPEVIPEPATLALLIFALFFRRLRSRIA